MNPHLEASLRNAEVITTAARELRDSLVELDRLGIANAHLVQIAEELHERALTVDRLVRVMRATQANGARPERVRRW